MPIIGDIASTTSGIDSATPIHSRRVRSRNSESSASPVPATGTSAMPHLGQLPGCGLRISGCMGQVYSAARGVGLEYRYQRHAALRATARCVTHDLRVHRAGVTGAAASCAAAGGVDPASMIVSVRFVRTVHVCLHVGPSESCVGFGRCEPCWPRCTGSNKYCRRTPPQHRRAPDPPSCRKRGLCSASQMPQCRARHIARYL